MNPLKALALMITVLLLTGCFASAPAYKLSDADRTKYSQTDPAELVAAAKARLKQAETDGLPLYAPKSYQQAQAAFEKVLKEQKKKSSSDSLVIAIAEVHHRLDAGYKNKDKVLAMVAENHALNKRLLELQAPNVAASAYKDIQETLEDIYEAVDEGNLAGAEKKRTALTKDQQALKIKLTKSQAIAELAALHEKLEDDDVEDVVPLSMKEAVTALEGAKRFIEANVDDAAGISAAVNNAMTLALRAQWMAARARQLAKIDTKSGKVEQILLEEEQWFAILSAGIGGESVRHLAIDEQAKTLADRARELNVQLAAARAKNGAAKSTTEPSGKMPNAAATTALEEANEENNASLTNTGASTDLAADQNMNDPQQAPASEASPVETPSTAVETPSDTSPKEEGANSQ